MSGLNVRRTRSWTEEANRLIAKGEESTASPEALLASYRKCLQRLTQECEFLNLKVTVIENSNNAEALNTLVAKELQIANEQWEEKLENLRKEFQTRISELCQCIKPQVSLANSSSTHRESGELEALKKDLLKFTERYYEDRDKLSSEFKLKLQLLEEEQNDCRSMIEDDKELQSEQKKLILAQLQQLHEEELEAIASKHNLEILSEKEKIEKLEFTIAEMQISSASENDMKSRIEFLEKENLLLKEQKVKMEMMIQRGDMKLSAESLLRVDDSSMLESGFSSGAISGDMTKGGTPSQDFPDLELLPDRKLETSFLERDSHLTQQLEELTDKLTGVDRERSRSQLGSARSLGVPSHSGRETPDDLPTASSPGPGSNNLKLSDFIKDDTLSDQWSNEPSPGFNKSFFNIPNRQEILFAFDTLTLEDKKQLIHELTVKCSPENISEPRENSESSMNETVVECAHALVQCSISDNLFNDVSTQVEGLCDEICDLHVIYGKEIMKIVCNETLLDLGYSKDAISETSLEANMQNFVFLESCLKDLLTQLKTYKSSKDEACRDLALVLHEKDSLETANRALECQLAVYVKDFQAEKDENLKLVAEAAKLQQQLDCLRLSSMGNKEFFEKSSSTEDFEIEVESNGGFEYDELSPFTEEKVSFATVETAQLKLNAVPVEQTDLSVEKASLRELLETVKAEKEDLLKQNTGFQEEVLKLKEEKAKFEENEIEINKLLDSNKDLQTQVEQLNCQIDDRNRVFHETCCEKSSLLQSCQEEIVELKASLETKVLEHQELSTRNMELKGKAQELKDMLKIKSEDYHELHERYRGMQANCEESFEVVQNLGNEVKILSDELVLMKTRLYDIENVETVDKDMQAFTDTVEIDIQVSSKVETVDIDIEAFVHNVDIGIEALAETTDTETEAFPETADSEIQVSSGTELADENIQTEELRETADSEVQVSSETELVDGSIQTNVETLQKDIQTVFQNVNQNIQTSIYDYVEKAVQCSNFMNEVTAQVYESELVHALMQESVADVLLDLKSSEMKHKIEELKNVISAKNAEIQELKTEIGQFNEEIQMLKRSLQEMTEKVFENDYELNGLKEMLAGHCEENSELKLSIDLVQNEKSCLQNEIIEFESQSSVMRNNINELTQESTEVKTQLEHLLQSNLLLNAELAEKSASVTSLEAQNCDLENAKNHLQTQVNDLNLSLESFKEGNQKFQEKFECLGKEKADLVSELGKVMYQNSEMEKKVDQMANQTDLLEKELEIHQNENLSIKSNLETLEKENSEMKCRIDSLESENSETKEKCGDLQAQRNAANASLELLEPKILELTASCDDLAALNACLNIAKTALECENEELRLSVEKSMNDMKVLELQVDQLKSENSDFVAKFEDEERTALKMEQDLNKLQEKNEKMKKKVEFVEVENKGLKDQIENFGKAVAELQKHNSELLAKVSDLVEYGDQLQNENEDLKSKMNNLETEKQSIFDVFRSIYKELSDLIGDKIGLTHLDLCASHKEMEEMIIRAMAVLRERFDSGNFEENYELKEVQFELEVKEFQLNEVMEKFEKEKSEKLLLAEKLNNVLGDLKGMLKEDSEDIQSKTETKEEQIEDDNEAEESDDEELAETLMLKLNLDSTRTETSFVAEDINLKDLVMKLKNVLEIKDAIIKQLSCDNELLKANLSKFCNSELGKFSEYNTAEVNEFSEDSQLETFEVQDQLLDASLTDRKVTKDSNVPVTANCFDQNDENLQRGLHALTENHANDYITENVNQRSITQLTSDHQSSIQLEAPISLCIEPKLEVVKKSDKTLTSSYDEKRFHEEIATKMKPGQDRTSECGHTLKSGVVFVESVTKGSPSKRLCGEGVCSKEVVKLMHSFDQQMANQMAIVDRKAREINELNELVKLLQTNNEDIRKHGDAIQLDRDHLADVLVQIASIHLEMIRKLGSELQEATSEALGMGDGCVSNTTDDKWPSLGLQAASQLESLVSSLKSGKIRSAQEIVNWEMDFTSPNATCGSLDSTVLDDSDVSDSKTLTPDTARRTAAKWRGGASKRGSIPRDCGKYYTELTQHCLEGGEGNIFGSNHLDQIVLSSSQELKTYINKLVETLSAKSDQKEKPSKQFLNEEIYTSIGETIQEIRSTLCKFAKTCDKSPGTNKDGKMAESDFHYSRLHEDPEHERFHGSPKSPVNKDDSLMESFDTTPSDVMPVKILRNLESLKTEIDLHAEEIERLKQKTETIGRLELSNEKMSAELSRKSDEINRVREEMSLLMTRNKDLSLFQEELKNKLVALGNSRSKLVGEKEEVENMVEVLKREFEFKENQKLEELKRENELKLLEVIQELEVIKEAVSVKDKQLLQMNYELNSLAHKLEAHTIEELSRSQTEFAQQEINLEDSLMRMNHVVEKNVQLLNQHKSQSVIVEKLQLANAELMQLVETKSQKISQMAEQIQNAAEQIRELNKLTQSLPEKDNEISQLRTQLAEVSYQSRKSVDDVTSQLELERAALEKSKQDHSAAVEHLGQKLAELQTMMETKDNNLRVIQNKIDVVVQWMDRVNVTKGIPSEFAMNSDVTNKEALFVEGLSDVDHPAALSLEMLQRSVEKVNVEIENMRNSNACVQQLSSDNEKLKTELEASLNEMGILKQEVAQLNASNEKLGRMCEELQSKEKDFAKLQYQLEVDKMTAFESLNAVKEQLTQEQTWKNDQNEQTQKEMTSLREEIDRLTQDLNSARSNASQLSTLRDQCEDSLKKIELEFQTKDQQNSHDLNKLHAANKDLEEQVGVLREECNGLKTGNLALEKRCSEIELEKVNLKVQYEQALKRLSLPMLPSPLEEPSKETIRDESVVLSQTPKLNLESPMVLTGSRSNQSCEAVEGVNNPLLHKTDLHCETIFGDMDVSSTKDVTLGLHHDLSKVSSLEDAGIDDVMERRQSDTTQTLTAVGGSARNVVGNQEDTERTSLRALNQALKDYIIQSNNVSAMADITLAENDWRLELIKSFQNVFIRERDLLIEEIETVAGATGSSGSSQSNPTFEKLQRKADRLTKVLQDSIAQIKVADRVSLINEVKDLRKKLGNRLLHHGGSDIDFNLMFKRMECKMNNLEGTLQNEKLLKENLRVELTLEQARKEQEMERVKEIEVELRAVQEQLRALQSSSHASGVGVLSETPLHKTYRKEQASEENDQELNSLKSSYSQMKTQLHSNKVITNLKKELQKEREMCAAYKTEAEVNRNYSNDIVAELSHLEQKTLYDLNDQITTLQTQLKASENSLNEKSRAFNIARATITDLTSQNESLKIENTELQKESEKLRQRICEIEKIQKEWAKKYHVRESEVKSLERSLKLANNKCNDLETSRDSRVGQLERQLETKERQLEEMKMGKDKLQRQVDSIMEQVDTCKHHIQRLTISKESFEAERANLMALVEEQKTALTKLEKENLSLKASSKAIKVIKNPVTRDWEAEKENFMSGYANTSNASLGNNVSQDESSFVEVAGADYETNSATNQECSMVDHATAYQQHVESVRVQIQIALTSFLEALQIFNTNMDRDSFMSESKLMLSCGNDCLSQLHKLAEKYIILPSKTCSKKLLSLNERLIQQNRELTDVTTLLTNEKLSLRRVLEDMKVQVGAKNSVELQIQKVYSAYLRADSRRRNLLYQKRYLLMLIESFRAYEDSALKMISEMGLITEEQQSAMSVNPLNRKSKKFATPTRRFKGAVRAVIAICRMRKLVTKWRHISNPTIPKHIAIPPLSHPSAAGMGTMDPRLMDSLTAASSHCLIPPAVLAAFSDQHDFSTDPVAHSEHWHPGAAGSSKTVQKQPSTSQSRYPNHSRHPGTSVASKQQQPHSGHSVQTVASNSSQCTYIKYPGSKRQTSSGSRKQNAPHVATAGVTNSEGDEVGHSGDQLVTKYKSRLREMQQQLTAIDFEG